MIKDVLIAAASLLSDDGENPEYDRAITELTADILGLDKGDAADILSLVRKGM
jgi:hypothetical protein